MKPNRVENPILWLSQDQKDKPSSIPESDVRRIVEYLDSIGERDRAVYFVRTVLTDTLARTLNEAIQGKLLEPQEVLELSGFRLTSGSLFQWRDTHFIVGLIVMGPFDETVTGK